MRCLQAVSFFQTFYPAPFPPVSEMDKGEMMRGPRAQTKSGLFAEAGENYWEVVMKVNRIVI